MDAPPATAVVVDVSARDGLQAEATALTPAARAAWVRRLLEAGVPEVEFGSFVHPAKVPQMAGAADVLRELAAYRERLWALVPNPRGLNDAADAGCGNVVCVVSATETHSRANLGRPVARVLDDLERMARELRRLGLRGRAAVSMAWVDPIEGPVPAAVVVDLCARLADMGFAEVTLCDTHGGAAPRAVADLVLRTRALFPPDALGLHLHDTFGTASASVALGWLAGVRRFEGAIGGLGGCPFSPGAPGNLDTLTLVRLLEGMGAVTGVDLAVLDAATRECLTALGRGAPARSRDDRNPHPEE